MKFVLSGMNLGVMVGQIPADIIYHNVSFYLIFVMGPGVIDFDSLLRVTVIEKGMA